MSFFFPHSMAFYSFLVHISIAEDVRLIIFLNSMVYVKRQAVGHLWLSYVFYKAFQRKQASDVMCLM